MRHARKMHILHRQRFITLPFQDLPSINITKSHDNIEQLTKVRNVSPFNSSVNIGSISGAKNMMGTFP
jgi:hypothetical protein